MSEGLGDGEIVRDKESGPDGEKDNSKAGPLPPQDEIIRLIIKIQQRLEDGEEDHHKWLVAAETADSQNWQDLSVMALHVLDTISNNQPINGIAISRRLEITKGAVSKITQKLLSKGLIVKEHLPDNKKEILFRLTGPGKVLYKRHWEFHLSFENRGKQALAKYSAEELNTIISFLNDLGNFM